ncbi:pentapeptide repeat-containing protein [Nocardia sp. R16R-3T]
MLVIGGGSTGFGVALLSGVHASFGQPLATALAGAGALTAGVLAYISGQRSRELAENHHQADSRRAKESALRDRYTVIATQIGDGSAAIRQAGVYALTALADDWHAFGEDDERQVCINLLQWYLRVPGALPDEESLWPDLAELEIRQTIVGILTQRRQLPAEDPKSWASTTISLHRASLPGCDLAESNLTGLDLDRADLRVVDLTDAKLTGAKLTYTKLVAADLDGVDLTGANLYAADLTEAYLDGADLTGAKLTYVHLKGAALRGANLTDACLTTTEPTSPYAIAGPRYTADLTGAYLTDANLTRADLTGANLTRADLTGANLTDTKLIGTDLTDAKLSKTDLTVTLTRDEHTRWPAGLAVPTD